MVNKTIKKGAFGDSKNISNRIILEAEREAEIIIENARKHAEEIINKARKDAEEIINKEVKMEYEKIKMEEKRRTAEISLKVKEIMLRERERIFNEVLNEVKKRLHEFKKTDAYASFLQELILEGCEAINSKDLIIKLDQKDKEIEINIEKLRKTIEERIGEKVNMSIVFNNISELGGVIVSTPDESIVYNNTLEAILERNSGNIRKIITKSILEGEKL
ncbi:MAG: V-type proton ATPase subunit E [archaeon YNP-LCB-024-027]|jgi:V/A-type H+-transporting ATPase subunit E|nr:V-type proton ATPase subunit E [Candidatus Culexarchaeum yellowstonense]